MIVQFNLQDQTSRLLLGIAYDRVYKFFKKYDVASHDEKIIAEVFSRLLTPGDESYKLLLFLTDGMAYGHCLFNIVREPEPYLFICQLETDNGQLSEEVYQEAFEILHKHSTHHNATKWVMITSRSPQAYKGYGFTPSYTTLVRNIDEEPLSEHNILDSFTPEQLEALAAQMRLKK